MSGAVFLSTFRPSMVNRLECSCRNYFVFVNRCVLIRILSCAESSLVTIAMFLLSVIFARISSASSIVASILTWPLCVFPPALVVVMAVLFAGTTSILDFSVCRPVVSVTYLPSVISSGSSVLMPS